MADSIPNDLLENLDFAQFKAQCIRILQMSDDEIAKTSDKEAKEEPAEMRKKYRFILDHTTEEDYENLRRSKRCETLKDEGNGLSSEGQYEEAIGKYERAQSEAGLMTSDQLAKPLIKTLHLNKAHAYLQLKQYKECIDEMAEVLKEDPYNVKALYRIALAHSKLGNAEQALEFIERTGRSSGRDALSTCLRCLALVVKLHEELAAKMCKKLSDAEIGTKVIELLKMIQSQPAGSASIVTLIKEELLKLRLVLSKEEAEELAKKDNLTRQALTQKIKELDKKRRFRQFMQSPNSATLMEDTEVLKLVDEALKDPRHELSQKIQRHFRNMTLEEVRNSIRGLRYRARWVGAWNTICSPKVFLIILCVMAVIAAIILYRAWYPPLARH